MPDSYLICSCVTSSTAIFQLTVSEIHTPTSLPSEHGIWVRNTQERPCFWSGSSSLTFPRPDLSLWQTQAPCSPDTWHSWNGIPVSPDATTPLQTALACSPTPSTPRWSILWFIFFLCPFFFPHAYPLTLEMCNLKAFSYPQTIALMRIRPFSGEAPALPEGIWAVPVASALVSSNPDWIVHLFFQQNSKGRFKTELTLNKCN